MPTYLYRCKSCLYEFEELQKISAESLKTCPSCKKEMLIRIIGGGGGLVFKGSGFYQTDYKKSGGEEKNKKSEKAEKTEKKTEATTEAKAESKTESTSETKAPEPSSSKPKNDSKE